MIICHHCNAENSPSALSGVITARCRECGRELIAGADYSRTQNLNPASRTQNLKEQDTEDEELKTVRSMVTPVFQKKYRFDQVLGRGGMGIVYAVYTDDLHRKVAMKILRQCRSAADQVRFVQEAQITGQLEHPNIVPIHEVGVNPDDRPFFTMKFVDGISLGDLIAALKRGDRLIEAEFSQSKLLAALVNVCNAVAFAHSKGVVHRDLKPANIMLGKFGEVMVMDWGLAKATRLHGTTTSIKSGSGAPPLQIDEVAQAAADAELNSIVLSFRNCSTNESVQGTITGTPSYMPPEQARGEISNIDFRSDVYALGAILYEILTLKPPARGKNMREILANAGGGNIDLPEVTAPNRRIPKELSAIAMMALSYDREDRYQSVQTFKQDLERFIQGVSVRARKDSLVESLIRLIKRNSAVSKTVAAATVVLLIVAALSFQQIEASKRRTEKEHREATQQKVDGLVAQGFQLLETAPDKLLTREKTVAQAALLFIRAQGLMGSNLAAEEGLRRASLEHFEIALSDRNWQQAWEKLEQARGANLDTQLYEAKSLALTEAQTERERFVTEQVRYRMADAKVANRKTSHASATKELIALKGPDAIKALHAYVLDPDSNCRALAIDSLAYMEDQSVVPAILENIKPDIDGKSNPLLVQESAVRAICYLAPRDRSTFKQIRGRIAADPAKNESRFYKDMWPHFAPYALLVLHTSLAEARERADTTAAEWFEMGLWCEDVNEPKLGVECFSQVIKQQPENCDAYLHRGCLQADPAVGLKDLDHGIKLNPKVEGAYWNRAKIKVRLKKYAEALEDYEQLFTMNANHSFGYVERGDLWFKLGNMTAAIKDCDTALRCKDKARETAIYKLRSRAWRELGNYTEALHDAEEQVSLHKADWDALQARGLIKQHLGMHNDAQHDFELALSLAQPAHARALVYSRLGDLKRVMRQPDQANKYYEKAVEAMPGYAWGVIGIAGVCRDLNDNGNAWIKIMTLAVNMNSEEACFERGAILDAQGNHPKALSEYELALKSNIRYVPAHKAIVALHEKLGEWKLQGEALSRWTNSVSFSAEAFHAHAVHLVTCPATDLRNVKQALLLAEKANELSNGRDPAILETLRSARIQNGLSERPAENLK